MRNERRGCRVSIDSVYPTAHPDPERVIRYSEMDPATQPPIDTVRGRRGTYTTDGNNRFFASLIRGDGDIEIRDADLPPRVIRNLLKMFGD